MIKAYFLFLYVFDFSELGVNHNQSLGKSSAFLKSSARITILSVLSRRVKNQTAILRNKEHSKVAKEFPDTESKVPGNQDNTSKDQSMNSTSVLPAQIGSNPQMLNEEANIADGNNEENEGSKRIPNGISGPKGNNCDENGNGVSVKSSCKSEPAVSKDRGNNVKGKYGRSSKSTKSFKTPFDYMKERKLSEPVMSPR